jgi:flavin reductase (DIM6/NTAB) family NADH-FMN oxidoreductase RutF
MSTSSPAADSTASFDTKAFRNALGRFATGVTVVTTLEDARPHGMTANAFMSVSLSPPLIVVSVDHRSNMHRILPGSRRFGVSVLAEHQESLSNHFAGRPQEGLDIAFATRHGIPLIDGALAVFVARLVEAHPAGDHTLYVGEVEYFETCEDRPLLFHAGKYRRLPDEIA